MSVSTFLILPAAAASLRFLERCVRARFGLVWVFACRLRVRGRRHPRLGRRPRRRDAEFDRDADDLVDGDGDERDDVSSMAIVLPTIVFWSRRLVDLVVGMSWW